MVVTQVVRWPAASPEKRVLTWAKILLATGTPERDQNLVIPEVNSNRIESDIIHRKKRCDYRDLGGVREAEINVCGTAQLATPSLAFGLREDDGHT
jgi:hypothetical protein